ncbi:MAG: AMP-binding protein [Blastocatellia bacterium]
MNRQAQTFCQKLADAAHDRPGKIAMRILTPGGGETISYRTMLAQVRALAWRLTQEQIAFGDRVALLGDNHPQWAMAYFGALWRGVVIVPLDPAATVDALTSFVRDAEVKLAFVSVSSLDKFRMVCEGLGQSIPVVTLQSPAPVTTPVKGYARFEDWAGTIPPPEFLAAAPPARAEDIAVLMYTSGTTGTPKAVPLTHGNILAESDGLEEAMKITEREVILGLLPLFHAYSQTVNLWLATIVGATVVYVTELSSAAIALALRQSQATALLGVPRLWYLFHRKILDEVKQRPAPVRWLFQLLLRLNGLLRDGLGINAGRLFFGRVHQSFGGRLRLAVSGGASFDVRVARDFHCLGFTILQGYGLTETAAAATATRFEDNLLGSVGTPLRDVEVRLDEANADAVGEVLIRGPIVTPGYYHNDQANREAFTADGWFRTGDLGRFDAAGHLFIVGRKKDVIKLPSGKNVFPEDVEAHYQRSPWISEICVLGVRDEAIPFARAEKLLAVVVPDFDYLKARGVTNATEWIHWELDNLGRALPEYQRVRDYHIRAEPLPRTTTRKIKRFALQQELETAAPAGQAQARDPRRFNFTAADHALLDAAAGRMVSAAIRQQKPDATVIHPQMNLELDLGLDSLARAECAVSIEQALGRTLDLNEEPALTVGDLIARVSAHAGADLAAGAPVAMRWHDILSVAGGDPPDIQPVLQRRPLFDFCAIALLRLLRLAARLLFGMEVTGLENLRHTPRPFLICPNHQSYLDALILSSLYPAELLRNGFHIGYADYFSGPLTARLARLLRIVPVDADTHLLRAMRAGAAGLRAGHALTLYPEGQRSIDGELMEFHKGAAILAAELPCPIVPVALDGLHRAWPRGARFPHPAKVRIRIGAPMDTNRTADDADDVEKDDEEKYAQLTARLRACIQRMLDEMRAEQ